jgi:uncharacterized Zn finger protein
MSNESSERKAVSTIEQRAQWEAMEFRLGAPNTIRVENVNYGAESGDHAYLVIVEDDETVEWTCPADGYQPGRCKHRVAVGANSAVLEAGSASVDEMREARR